MKVLMIARPNLYSVPGGDTIQIKNTAAALQKLGVTVDISITGAPHYTSYDLIHFFNIIDPEDILGHVYRANLPFVVSTIYVDYSEYDRFHRKDIVGKLSKIFSTSQVEYFKTVTKVLLKNERVSSPRYFLKGHAGSIRYILERAACLLPNSENEYSRLEHDFKITRP